MTSKHQLPNAAELDSRPVLTFDEQGIVERVLEAEFASRDPASLHAARLVFELLVGRRLPEVGINIGEESLTDWRLELAELREVLLEFVTDYEGARAALLPRMRGSLDGISLTPVMKVSGNRVETTYTIVAGSFLSMRSYVLALLVDEERAFGRNLGHCALESCGRFFLVDRSGAGRPQRRYCSPEHMHEFHARQAAERVRRSRARAKRHK